MGVWEARLRKSGPVGDPRVVGDERADSEAGGEDGGAGRIHSVGTGYVQVSAAAPSKALLDNVLYPPHRVNGSISLYIYIKTVFKTSPAVIVI